MVVEGTKYKVRIVRGVEVKMVVEGTKYKVRLGRGKNGSGRYELYVGTHTHPLPPATSRRSPK